jgi:hypothetical protein
MVYLVVLLRQLMNIETDCEWGVATFYATLNLRPQGNYFTFFSAWKGFEQYECYD